MSVDSHPYHSQKGQDQWVVEEVFHGKRDGYFVDLAASDGIAGNNTYVLEMFYGWSGIAVEPDRRFFEALRRNRRCACDSSVIDGWRRRVQFIELGELGGIVADDTDNNPRIRASVLDERRELICERDAITLEDLLERHRAPRVIDFLSLDVEGAEERILSTFPFDRYLFVAMCIERPTAELNRRLFEHGYLFVRKSRVGNPFDSFYVHATFPRAESLACEPFSETPRKDW